MSFLAQNYRFCQKIIIYDNLEIPIKSQGETRYKTVIENNVWIGANAIVMRE